MKLATRMSRLGTETAFEVLVKARALEAQGREIIHLEIGEPDFDTPSHIVEAGVKALRQGRTRYTPSAGIPPAQGSHRRGDLHHSPHNPTGGILTRSVKNSRFKKIRALRAHALR